MWCQRWNELKSRSIALVAAKRTYVAHPGGPATKKDSRERKPNPDDTTRLV